MRRVLLVLVLLGALLGQSVMPAAAQTSVGYRFHVWHDGNPIIGDDGAVELADADQANEEWAKMVALEFDCPTLPADDLSANAEKLGITLGIMRTLKPIIAES